MAWHPDAVVSWMVSLIFFSFFSLSSSPLHFHFSCTSTSQQQTPRPRLTFYINIAPQAERLPRASFGLLRDFPGCCTDPNRGTLFKDDPKFQAFQLLKGNTPKPKPQESDHTPVEAQEASASVFQPVPRRSPGQHPC